MVTLIVENSLACPVQISHRVIDHKLAQRILLALKEAFEINTTRTCFTRLHSDAL